MSLSQAEAEYNRNDTAVYNMRTVVGMCARAVDDRWRKYDTLFEHVLRTVSSKFMGYMYRRGHQVRLKSTKYSAVQKCSAETQCSSQVGNIVPSPDHQQRVCFVVVGCPQGPHRLLVSVTNVLLCADCACRARCW